MKRKFRCRFCDNTIESKNYLKTEDEISSFLESKRWMMLSSGSPVCNICCNMKLSELSKVGRRGRLKKMS